MKEVLNPNESSTSSDMEKSIDVLTGEIKQVMRAFERLKTDVKKTGGEQDEELVSELIFGLLRAIYGYA